jgi:hypothetical protein
MNFAFFVTLQPHALRDAWVWVPKIYRSKPGHGFYINWSWLCFGGQIDNEW